MGANKQYFRVETEEQTVVFKCDIVTKKSSSPDTGKDHGPLFCCFCVHFQLVWIDSDLDVQ